MLTEQVQVLFRYMLMFYHNDFIVDRTLDIYLCGFRAKPGLYGLHCHDVFISIVYVHSLYRMRIVLYTEYCIFRFWFNLGVCRHGKYRGHVLRYRVATATDRGLSRHGNRPGTGVIPPERRRCYPSARGSLSDQEELRVARSHSRVCPVEQEVSRCREVRFP